MTAETLNLNQVTKHIRLFLTDIDRGVVSTYYPGNTKKVSKYKLVLKTEKSQDSKSGRKRVMNIWFILNILKSAHKPLSLAYTRGIIHTPY